MSFRPEALTGALFDSVCDDDAFAALPRLIAGLTGAVSVHFQTHGVTGVCTEAQYGHSDGVLDGYKAYFWEKDPWIEGYRETRLQHRRVLGCADQRNRLPQFGDLFRSAPHG